MQQHLCDVITTNNIIGWSYDNVEYWKLPCKNNKKETVNLTSNCITSVLKTKEIAEPGTLIYHGASWGLLGNNNGVATKGGRCSGRIHEYKVLTVA